MPFDAFQVLRLVHVAAATLWVGGIVFHMTVLAPAAKAAGPGAGPVMRAILRRGGFGRFYGIAAAFTILSGLYVYWDGGYASDPFASASAALVTLGAGLGLLAFAAALALGTPIEAKLKKLERSIPEGSLPTPEQGQQFQRLGAIAMQRGWITLALIVGAFLAMASRGLLL